jgi:RanGTP-binding protein
MDQLLSQVALTSASFVGRAAWSYASGIALKKITKQIEETTGNSKLTFLEKKLQRKLSVLTPVIDTIELLQAQGREDLQPILTCCDELREKLKKTSLENPSEEDLKELIEMIDDLIPLIGLVKSANVQRSESISCSRLLNASAAIVTGDAIMTYTRPSTAIQIATPFPVRLYSLFEGSIRKKNSPDTTWKEDFTRATVTVERVALTGSRTYQLKIVQDLDDGRYHEEDEIGSTKLIGITDIVKMYYTISGKLLNIADATLPVLVLKLSSPEMEKKNTSATPRSAAKTEWIALELYRDDKDDNEEEDEGAKNLTRNLESLEIDSGGPAIEADTHTPLDSLCLLEYLIRLCSLESNEVVSHTKVDDRIFNLYFQVQPSASILPITKPHVQSPAPTPTKGTLLTRFLSE